MTEARTYPGMEPAPNCGCRTRCHVLDGAERDVYARFAHIIGTSYTRDQIERHYRMVDVAMLPEIKSSAKGNLK